MDFSGRSLQEWFPYATLLGSTVDTCLASTRLLVEFHFISRGGLWEMTSGLSPYSVLSLVRQRTHALRQSPELFEEAHIFSTWCLWEMTQDCLRIQR